MVGKLRDGFAQHGEPVLDGKAGPLVRVHAHCHDETVKQLCPLLDHPQMPDGERIKATGINSQPAALLGRFHRHRITTPVYVSAINVHLLWKQLGGCPSIIVETPLIFD